MEAWEELDLDDSDLPSLLHPCKRHHPLPSQISFNSTSTYSQLPILQRCSQSQHSNPQTLPPQSQHEVSPRLIPGPAGAVLTAMNHRRSQIDRDTREEQGMVSTQEFVRKVVEEGEDDEDFERSPWLCAVDFLTREGMVDMCGTLLTTPLCSIKKSNIDRVDRVVAIIKSCTPNGLGDMIVTLKDPTGTMGASIHRSVLMDGNFGNDIYVGAILILQKMAVFSPVRAAQYLNITLRNMVKVISKDIGPPSKQSDPLSPFNLAPPTGRQQDSSQLQGRTEGILNNLRQKSTVRKNMHTDKERGDGNLTSGSESGSIVSSGNQNRVVEKDYSVAAKDAPTEKIAVGITSDEHDEGFIITELPKPSNQSELGKLSDNNHCTTAATNLMETPGTQENGNIERVEKHKATPMYIVKTALAQAQWTDEQLEELLAFD